MATALAPPLMPTMATAEDILPRCRCDIKGEGKGRRVVNVKENDESVGSRFLIFFFLFYRCCLFFPKSGQVSSSKNAVTFDILRPYIFPLWAHPPFSTCFFFFHTSLHHNPIEPSPTKSCPNASLTPQDSTLAPSSTQGSSRNPAETTTPSTVHIFFHFFFSYSPLPTATSAKSAHTHSKLKKTAAPTQWDAKTADDPLTRHTFFNISLRPVAVQIQ